MAASLIGPGTASTAGPDRRPVLTAVVCAVTVAVSVAALFSPAVMDVFTRDLAQLRAGQWWRAFTPVLVQSDGWGQLAVQSARPRRGRGCPGAAGQPAVLGVGRSARRSGQHRRAQCLET